MKLTKPIKGMVKGNITQGYHSKHKALDIVSFFDWFKLRGYGTPLCAPEDVEILSITGASASATVKGSIKHGYGVFMKGLESGYTHLFWHTLPVLPVSVGEKVNRGEIVAFMGNAGLVYENGVYVPEDKRTQAPHAGTHLHWEMLGKNYKIGGKKTFSDPSRLIDWSLEPKYNLFTFIAKLTNILAKTKSLIKNDKDN